MKRLKKIIEPWALTTVLMFGIAAVYNMLLLVVDIGLKFTEFTRPEGSGFDGFILFFMCIMVYVTLTEPVIRLGAENKEKEENDG